MRLSEPDLRVPLNDLRGVRLALWNVGKYELVAVILRDDRVLPRSVVVEVIRDVGDGHALHDFLALLQRRGAHRTQAALLHGPRGRGSDYST